MPDRVAVARACVWLATCVLIGGCKRDADAPLPKDELFPTAPQHAANRAPNPFGALPRANSFPEREPNDGPERAQPLADKMADAWISFARDGDPNTGSLPDWPAFDDEARAFMRFTLEPAVETGYFEGEKAVLSALD